MVLAVTILSLPTLADSVNKPLVFTKKSSKSVSQNVLGRCCSYVDAQSEVVIVANAKGGEADFEAVFRAQYNRIARFIAGIIRDHARAEDLAVEVFLKWDRHPGVHGERAVGWLYRTALRAALNELRRELRRSRYEAVFALFASQSAKTVPSPEQISVAKEEQEQVRAVLNVLRRRDAELLLLRNSGLSYGEIADALHLNPLSVGTLLNRAEEAFREEFRRLHGD